MMQPLAPSGSPFLRGWMIALDLVVENSQANEETAWHSPSLREC